MDDQSRVVEVRVTCPILCTAVFRVDCRGRGAAYSII